MKKKLLSILVVTLSVLSLTGCTDREEELDNMLDECLDYAEEGDGAMARELYNEAMDYAEEYDLEIDEDDLEELEDELAMCDLRLLDTIRTAILTSALDPSTMNDEASAELIDEIFYGDGEEYELSDLDDYADTLFVSRICDVMGVESIDEILDSIVSEDDAVICIQSTGQYNVAVWLEGTDLIVE